MRKHCFPSNCRMYFRHEKVGISGTFIMKQKTFLKSPINTPGKIQESITFPHWAYRYMQSLLWQGSGLLLWSDVPGSLLPDHLSLTGGGSAQWSQGGHGCAGREIDRLLGNIQLIDLVMTDLQTDIFTKGTKGT